MKKLAPSLVWLVVILSQTRIQSALDTDFEHEFKRAVVQAYNASMSFSHNFYELLGLICPESVYCQTNGTFDKGNAGFGGHITEDILGTDGFLLNYNQTAISEARIFLQMNAEHLRGCCVSCSCNSDCRERHNCCPSMDSRIADTDILEQTSLNTLEPTSLVTLEPTSLATLEASSLNTLEPSSLATLEASSLATLEPSSIATLKPPSIATLEPSSIATLKPSSLATLEPSSIATLEPSSIATQECVYANTLYYVDGAADAKYPFEQTVGNSFFMVTDCASATMGDDIATKCTHPDTEEPDEMIPVYSTALKRIYKNIFCARCNNANSVTAMTALITITNRMSLTETNRLPGSLYELWKMSVSTRRLFDMSFTFPRYDLDIKNFGCARYPSSLLFGSARCDSNSDIDSNQIYLFKRACEMELHLYYTNTLPFRNVFCFLCSSHHIIHGTRTIICGKHVQHTKGNDESFSVLIRPRQLDATVQSEEVSKTEDPCSCSEVFDKSKKRCREVLCPPGEMRIGCACEPFYTNITGLRIRLHLEILPKLPDNVSQQRELETKLLQNDAPAAITKAVRRLIASRFGPFTSIDQFLFRERAPNGNSSWTLHYCERLMLPGISDDRKELKKMFTKLHAGLTKKIVGTQMQVFLGRNFDFDSRSSSVITITDPSVGTKVVLDRLFSGLDVSNRFNWREMSQCQPLKKLMYCKRMKLDDEEIEMVYNVTMALGWSQAYLECVHREEDGDMCLEDFEAAFMPVTSGAGGHAWVIPRRELLVISAWVIYMN